jgi:hypothetical protein
LYRRIPKEIIVSKVHTLEERNKRKVKQKHFFVICERINTLEADCSGNSSPLQRKNEVSSISGVKDGYYSLSGIYLGKSIKENVNAVYIHIQDGKSIKVFIDPTHSKLD